MYCNHCGQLINENASVCVNCGYEIVKQKPTTEDKPSLMFALIGFFVPIVGLILFIVFNDEKPKQAKSAGKGALISVIVSVVASIIFTILFFALGFGLMNQSLDGNALLDDNVSASMHSFTEEYQWTPYVDIEVGELHIIENEFFMETELDVTVTNKHDKKCSYYITIEAVDENGYRLSTDMIFVDTLNSNQSIKVEAFEFVDAESVEDYQNATFNVLKVSQIIAY